MTASTYPGPYGSPEPYSQGEAPSRHSALTAAAANIRARQGLQIPVERILLGAAAVLFPLGLVLILLGWYGAAHTGRTYAQIDYLISGGLLGLGLSVAGGFMYFGYWLSKQLAESRHQSSIAMQALRRLDQILESAGVPTSAGGNGSSRPGTNGSQPLSSETTAAVAAAVVAATAALARPSAPAAVNQLDGTEFAPEPPAAPARAARRRTTAAERKPATRTPPPEADVPTGEVAFPMLVATARGSLLHRRDCPVVASRDGLRSIPAGTDGFGYCTMCDAQSVIS